MRIPFVRIPTTLSVSALSLSLLCGPAGAQQAAPLPRKHAPQPTSAAISASDLMTRLYIVADDSMQGRQTGTPGHVKATAYIASELRRFGLTPAGDDGSFFQNVPVVQRAVDPASTLRVGGTSLHAIQDFVPGGFGRGGGVPAPLNNVPVIYGGVQGDTASTLTAEQARGKLVLFSAPSRGAFGRGGRGRGFGRGFGRGGRGGRGNSVLSEAAGTATILSGEAWTSAVEGATPRPGSSLAYRGGPPSTQTAPFTISVSEHAAEVLLGMPPSRASVGTVGRTVSGALRYVEKPVPARNVVAVLRGSDPALRGEYVAFGAHNDHIGIRYGRAVDHDSLHMYNAARYAIVGMFSNRGGPQPSQAQRDSVAAIHIDLAAWRKSHPVRMDSINNGADDDGSGTVTELEIAQAFASLTPAQRPKRSLLFVWHVGEENGLWGSEYFTDHPTVPRDSIVTQLNMDMVGRGDKRDLPVGGPTYLQLVGSRRLSTELGDIVEKVNGTEPMPFHFDYQFDANGHPERIYCRSDHYNYARYGIPITFFTTGLHGDYHQVTDEPQYIDYAHMARVGKLVYDIGMTVANLDHRPAVDHEKPDPHGTCVQ